MDNKFNFFESYHRALARLSDSSYGRLVRGMAKFIFDGKEPSFTKESEAVAWDLIRPILEKGQELSQIRAEAGKKGGENGKGKPRNIGNQHAVKTKANQIQNNNGKGIGKGIGFEENIKRKENNYGNNNRSQDNIADAQNKFLAEIAQSQSISATAERPGEVHETFPFG